MGWLEGGRLLTWECGDPSSSLGCASVTVIFGRSLSFSEKAVDFLHTNVHSSAQTEHRANHVRGAQISQSPVGNSK